MPSLGLLLKVPLDQDNFFMEAHMKLRPVDFSSDGLFLCGTAHSPKSVEETVAQAEAAAGRASVILNKGSFTADAAVAAIKNDEMCRGCEQCINVCEFNAITMTDQGGDRVSRINSLLCKGCGVCAATCPSGAITARHFGQKQVLAMINAALYEEGDIS